MNQTVEATLHIYMYVVCPNDDCRTYINLLDSRDTSGVDYNGDNALLQQMFPQNASHDDFECEQVTCTLCKTTFDVKGLEW